MGKDKRAEYCYKWDDQRAGKNGVCIAFSCAFRAMLEAVPFNPSTGLVDWNCTEPDHIRVAIVEDGKHMWNAIQNDQGKPVIGCRGHLSVL